MLCCGNMERKKYSLCSSLEDKKRKKKKKNVILCFENQYLTLEAPIFYYFMSQPASFVC